MCRGEGRRPAEEGLGGEGPEAGTTGGREARGRSLLCVRVTEDGGPGWWLECRRRQTVTRGLFERPAPPRPGERACVSAPSHANTRDGFELWAGSHPYRTATA